MIIRLITILTVAFIIITVITLMKYKLAFRVTIDGQEVGYVSSKAQFQKLVDDEILNSDEENVAFVEIEQMPSYNVLLIENGKETDEQEIFSTLKEAAVTTYRLYAITVDNENTTYVNSRDEAETIIGKIKEDAETDEIEIGIQEIYTQNVEESKQAIEAAKNTDIAEEKVVAKIEEQEEIKASTFEGIYFSMKPVSGIITSRFGVNEDIRDHTHMGMDIAAPNGTPIQAPAAGEVTYAGWMDGYGNLVIISHGNGVQTYYGHASKLYVSVGDTVEPGDVIAAVGSTGYSTGDHLHFEIRKDGSQVNPERYVYR